ncbi:transposase [Clostridium sp. PL3]|uniref:Transposase n=1 Tax=Clostridium thailandense TaxID=2794346 RepID=A0A949TJ46_9CLOT|nr:transposase [Clostridium thailandense]MBV7271487.1 transposase [Clostridium thailandense]
MPTKKRAWYPGASYHITARGNHRNDIFKEEEDFQYYLMLMYEALNYYNYNNYKIISYCLMNNHMHLQLKTQDAPVGQFMGRINSKYAKYYNKKYNYIGHLFQDRYNSVLIENDQQMLETSRYIHLNPIRAKMVKRPEEYQYSSYGAFIGIYDEEIISSNLILDYFNEKRKRILYKKFVEEVITSQIAEDK